MGTPMPGPWWGGWGSSRIPPPRRYVQGKHTPRSRRGPYKAKVMVLSCLWGRRGPGQGPGLIAWPSPDAPSL